MIKIKSNELGDVDKTDTTDKGKRIYRAAVDTIRRLDVILKEKKAYRSAFTQEAVGLRNRLKEYCERLIFLDTLLYGNKCEEILWRKVFYSIILIAKKNKRHMHSHSSVHAAFRTHMSAATGFYHHLLFKLQSHFSLNLEGVTDFHLLHSLRKENVTRNMTVTELERGWAMKASHQCLVYLGDIARYQDMFDEGSSKMLAQRYYYQALALFPNIGMPYNQLGILHSSHYYCFDSAYHYIRCIVSEISFESTRHNLQRLFDRNKKYYRDVDARSPKDTTLDMQRCRDVRRLFSCFIKLLDIFFNPNLTYTSGSHDIQEVCQSALQDFNLCMFYHRDAAFADCDWSRPTYLTADIVYKLVVAGMAAVHYQQKCGCAQVTAAIAFFLALASHITNHVVCLLQQALETSRNPVTLPTVENEDEENSDTDDLSPTRAASKPCPVPIAAAGSDPPKNQSTKPAKKKLKSKSRRRRRKLSGFADSSSEGSEDSVSANDSDLSDDDNLSVSSLSDDFIDCSDHGSDSDLDDTLLTSRAAGNQRTESAQNFPDMQKIWCDEGADDNLVLFSSKLFTSSATASFLCGNDKSGGAAAKVDENKSGFHTDCDDDYAAEIEEKIANFVIDTDTEAVPTDADIASDSDSERDSSPEEAAENKLHCMIMQILSKEPLIPVVKIISDWLTCHVQIIKTCAQSSLSLWSSMAMLLNLVPSEDAITTDPKLNLLPGVRNHLGEASEAGWVQRHPLREDTNLRCFTPLSAVHEHINFDLQSRLSMTEDNELAARLVSLRHFGYFMSSLPELDFSYSTDESLFIGPVQSDQKVHDASSHLSAQEKLTTAETCKNRLMRDMAQLRLQKEVDELQGELASTEQPTFPPYIVADSWCLCEELHIIKRLALTSRCIIIIPLSVIDTLDMKKKDSIGARKAIRWLECEFKRGNRYVRDQKASERSSMNLRKKLKKKKREAWEMVMTIDCACYLTKQSGQLHTANMVTVLVNRDVSEWATVPEVIHAANTAKNEGVSIERIKSFHTKWMDIWKQWS